MNNFKYFTAAEIKLDANGKKKVNFPKGWSKFKEADLPKHIKPNHKVLCVLTGKINNITVFDFDDIASWELIVSEFPEIQNGYVVKTPRGYHAYCKYNKDYKTTSDKTLKIDIRNDGGLIFGAGTKRNDGKVYTLINDAEPVEFPQNLYEKYFNTIPVATPVEAELVEENSIEDASENEGDFIQIDATPENIAGVLANTIDIKYIYNYADWIKIVWAMRSVGLDKDFAIYISKKADNYTDEGFNKIWNNNKTDSVGIGTLKFYSRLSNEYQYLNLMAFMDDYPDCIKSPSDISVGKKIIDILADDILVQGKDNDVYIYYNTKWVKDTSGNLVKQVINNVLNNYVSIHIKQTQKIIRECQDDNQRDLYSSRLKDFKNAKHKFNMINSLNNYYKAVIQTLATPDKKVKFDEKPYLFMFKNKCWNFEICDWVTPSKYDYILTTTQYDYREPTEAELKEVTDLFEKIFPDEEVRKTYTSVLYQGMIGVNNEKFIVANGSGGNGKGVINELFLDTIGDYGCKGHISLITQQAKAGGNPELAKLNNMRCVFFTEPSETMKFALGMIKDLTGGSKTDARMNYSNETETLLKCMIITEVNVKLAFDGKCGESLARRLMDILFESTFTDNPTILQNKDLKNVFPKDERYKSQEFKDAHRHALFKYIVENAEKKIYTDKKTQERSNEYIDDNDDLLTFWNDTYELIKEGDKDEPIKFKDMKYNNIKRLLRFQIEKNIKALWTFDEGNQEFTYLYKVYDDDLKIYTPQQLIDYLDEISM